MARKTIGKAFAYIISILTLALCNFNPNDLLRYAYVVLILTLYAYIIPILMRCLYNSYTKYLAQKTIGKELADINAILTLTLSNLNTNGMLLQILY